MTMSDVHNTLKIKVSSIEGLFDAQDPRNIPERNLNSEWLEYIFEIMNDKNRKGSINLEILVSSVIGPDWNQPLLPDMLKKEFKSYDTLLKRRLKDNFRLGRISLAIALITLAVFIILSEIMSLINLGIFQRAFEEGFIIIGWVALWRPVEILLFDWWPIVDRRRKVARILSGKITVKQM